MKEVYVPLFWYLLMVFLQLISVFSSSFEFLWKRLTVFGEAMPMISSALSISLLMSNDRPFYSQTIKSDRFLFFAIHIRFDRFIGAYQLNKSAHFPTVN